mgnify:CR=1 FL=1
MKRLIIGNVELENNLILAPMAGVTDLSFRLLCKEQGAGLVCMEMVSAKALYYRNRNTKVLLEKGDGTQAQRKQIITLPIHVRSSLRAYRWPLLPQRIQGTSRLKTTACQSSLTYSPQGRLMLYAHSQI